MPASRLTRESARVRPFALSTYAGEPYALTPSLSGERRLRSRPQVAEGSVLTTGHAKCLSPPPDQGARVRTVGWHAQWQALRARNLGDCG